MKGTTTGHDWFADVRVQGVGPVAQVFGLKLGRSQSLTPCPACGQATRHRKTSDKRGAVGITKAGLGWRCFQCDASGDAVTVAALMVTGKANPSREQWPDVRRTCAERGLCEADPRDGRPVPAVRRLSPPPSPSPASLKRPPLAEVQALWRASRPVTEDTAVTAWLEDRGLDSAAVENSHLARALPEGASLPRWARFQGRPWSQSGHRLIVPLWSATGVLESLHARNVSPNVNPGDKAASPAGAEVRGLIMADPLARLMLARRELGDGTSAGEAVRAFGLIVVEGEPDFLTWGSRSSDGREDAPAVLGVIAGSWTPDLAARIPDGCRIAVRTHVDSAGEKYAKTIIQPLAARCLCYRLEGGSGRA